KSPCEEFAEKYENCMKEACKDYSSCATCSQQSIDAIVKGFKDAKCEGQLKTETEDKLKNFNCDNMKASVKSACSASGK
ncbi:MAG: hypothetical protein N2746_11880, partial [Deltaproteobacteria bacterium]|nr:hypothetical protein [Deltaproteobacteria bacterium]